MASTTRTIFARQIVVADTALPVMHKSTPFYSANFHVEDNDVYYGDGTTMTATAVSGSTISLEKGDLQDMFFMNKVGAAVAKVSIVATVDKQYTEV